jgi:ribosomal subunit interface protein
MDIHVTARHCTITEAENTTVVETAMSFERYGNSILRVDAIIDKGPLDRICEFTVKIQGQLLVAKESAADVTKAVHDAGEKIHRQLSRIHDKVSTIRPQQA